MPPNPGLPQIASIGGAATTCTFDQSGSISSARIKGSDVIDPCPISVAADMMVMEPWGAMLPQGERALPVRSVAKVAAGASGAPSTKANDSPAAPIITWRRETEVLLDVVVTFVVMAQASRVARSTARTMR